MTRLLINQRVFELNVAGHETWLEVLRDQLGLTGTKSSCEEGECGACTVIVSGKAVLACMILAKDLEGEEILTIEGLAQGDELHPIQNAFLKKGAVQCGFCIPGMVMATKALLDENPEPTDAQIKLALDGNICRCSGYLKIMDAVRYAAQQMAGKDS